MLDTEKRLNILFDHLNNETLLKPDTIESMEELAQALSARDYETAQAIQLDLHTNKLDQCGQWMVSDIFNSFLPLGETFNLLRQPGRCQAFNRHEQSDALVSWWRKVNPSSS